MDKRLINTLLRIFHSQESRFSPGRSISAFCTEYNLGMRQGASLIFTEEDKKEIGRILQGEMGIDPATTTSESWKYLGRAQSLRLAHDEKFAGRSVGAGRLRLKTFPERALRVAGGRWTLPLRADLGLDLDAVLGHEIGHDALLVIENLQTFDDIHNVGVDVMGDLAACEPLVLYRGDTQGGARADAIRALIENTALPVYAFVDYDPAGLVIAHGLPRLDRVLAPRLQDLAALIQTHGIARRYLDQVAAASHVLQQLEADPRIGPLWDVIDFAGKGLPQEYFHSRSAQSVRRSI
ncbi:MAG TPA: hypothetical protein VI457_13875 [Methylococcaceae bacterium]|nr:hypothetical protein [Methylococcaceae bacterium]